MCTAIKQPNNLSPRLSAQFSEINWDFPKANGSKSIHSFHSYPAKFIPEIPRVLLKHLSPPTDTLVFDPFCGSGTTLVEAQRAGFSSCGVDLNPIGCLISRVKTTPLPKDFIKLSLYCAKKADSLNTKPPQIPNLLHWFKPEVCGALASLRLVISKVNDPVAREALEAVFSSIIVKVSNQDSDTRYAAVPKKVDRESVFNSFVHSANQLDSLERTSEPSSPVVTVLNQNIFDVQPNDIPGDIGLVITSPPYPNAYEYWLYHKYRMWWLGYDPLAVKNNEIGARAHFFTERRHKEDFNQQMTQVFLLLKETMRVGALCCFVVGDSKIHGEIVDNSEKLSSAANKLGFKLVYKADRLINPFRKSFNLHHARIKREHILVWER